MIVESEDLKPVVGTAGSAGYDLRVSGNFPIMRGQTIKVGTGLKVEIPKGYVGLVTPRSSTSEYVLANTVGVIDSDYQGEIFLKIRNVSNGDRFITRGDRLFQLVIVPVFMEKPIFVKEFTETTKRGSGGDGSTGKA